MPDPDPEVCGHRHTTPGGHRWICVRPPHTLPNPDHSNRDSAGHDLYSAPNPERHWYKRDPHDK